MRFMMFMLPNLPDDADWMPTAEAVAEMTKYNESLAKAGVLLEGSGLHSQSEGVRVTFSNGRHTVTDGPFSEAKEVIGGFAVYSVKTKQEAIEWATRFMNLHKQHWPGWEGETELRQLMEFGPPA